MPTANIVTVNGITATPICLVGSHQRLWRVQSGSLILHRITSKSPRVEETFIFASSEDGVITDWCELPGSCSGESSHVEAITAHLSHLSRI